MSKHAEWSLLSDQQQPSVKKKKGKKLPPYLCDLGHSVVAAPLGSSQTNTVQKVEPGSTFAAMPTPSSLQYVYQSNMQAHNFYLLEMSSGVKCEMMDTSHSQ